MALWLIAHWHQKARLWQTVFSEGVENASAWWWRFSCTPILLHFPRRSTRPSDSQCIWKYTSVHITPIFKIPTTVYYFFWLNLTKPLTGSPKQLWSDLGPLFQTHAIPLRPSLCPWYPRQPPFCSVWANSLLSYTFTCTVPSAWKVFLPIRGFFELLCLNLKIPISGKSFSVLFMYLNAPKLFFSLCIC